MQTPLLHRRIRLSLVTLLVSLGLLVPAHAGDAPVKVWEEPITIPTYLAGDPEPNPMFFFGRGSQGAQGHVYPYPLYDTLTNKKVDKTYKMVYLENEYVRIGVLPEIGGRIFEGIDKTNNYNFFYRQHVIKPALIGLIGAWISGGVEWNIPHHHRATTFIPVQYLMEENGDGSKTIWVGELEVRHRMRWAVGYTLRPGKSYLEASIRIVNRTPVVNTMLCFANVAVHTNQDYQVIFPPSTQFGTYHGKREFIDWPIASTRYNGADFTAGVDVSWYKNHISNNSIFAWNYEDDFFAGYDHGKQAGLMSVADHNIAPGKKLWTWGNGPHGRMWDRILTDDDGPYIELMVGAYSDNQPDYSWLQPYETKSFSLHWYPFRQIDGVKKANLDAAVNLDVKGGRATVGFCTTSAQPAAKVSLKAGAHVLLEETVAIDPGNPFVKEIGIPAGLDEHDLVAAIWANGKELVSYSPIRLEKKAMPGPVTPPLPPKDIKTNEELYLTGLRIEQFHDPMYHADAYWDEALRRDPGDIRVNTVLGIDCFKKARYAEAEKLLRKAIERLTDKYTSPKDAEAIYYLGLTLKAQGKTDEAFATLYKATWSTAWRSAGYLGVAEIASMRGDMSAALQFAEQSLQANALNVRALSMRAAALRHLGRSKEAWSCAEHAAALCDPLDVRLRAECWLAFRNPANTVLLTEAMNRHPATAEETAAEYLDAGLWQDGADVLQAAVDRAPKPSAISPMVYYYLGYFSEKLNQEQKAADYYKLAAQMPSDYCFPFENEASDVLRAAIQANPRDALAPYYLGNLLYDWQPEEATKLWEQSAAIDGSNAVVLRNLAIAYSHQKGGDSQEKAIASLEKAVSCERKYAIHFAELDELYAAAGAPVEKRLATIEKYPDVVAGRDDALARAIALKVFAGKCDEAIKLMTGRRFAVWEGGSLSVADSWTDAHLLRGHQLLAQKRYRDALAAYQTAIKLPENIPSERQDSREAEGSYWIGCAYEALGDMEQAKATWQKSASAKPPDAPRPRRGRSGGSAQSYYQAMSLAKLGQTDEAKKMFQAMVDSATESLKRGSSTAESAPPSDEEPPRRSPQTRLAQSHYLAGLGYLGLNEKDKAKQELAESLKISPDHLGAKEAMARIAQ